MLLYANGSHVVDSSVALAAHIHMYSAAHAASCLPSHHGPGYSSGSRLARTRSDRAMRAGAQAPARTPSGQPRPLARCAHAGAPGPHDVSARFAAGRPVVVLLAEELAEAALRLEPRSSARRDQLLHVGPADVGDEAGAVVDGAKVHRRCSSTRARTQRPAPAGHGAHVASPLRGVPIGHHRSRLRNGGGRSEVHIDTMTRYGRAERSVRSVPGSRTWAWPTS